MKKAILFVCLICVTSLSACAPIDFESGTSKRTVPWVATDGSKSGATIKMECSYDELLETPNELYEAQNIAMQKCQAWGYDQAEPFGGITTKCLSLDCHYKKAEIIYQCLGTVI